jgi:hypothetical protein
VAPPRLGLFVLLILPGAMLVCPAEAVVAEPSPEGEACVPGMTYEIGGVSPDLKGVPRLGELARSSDARFLSVPRA